MKMALSSRGLFVIGFLILAVTNIVVLAGVASNRSANPEAQIILTERELQLPYRPHKENSGLSLKLTWRVLGGDAGYSNYGGWQSPSWFNSEKLEELGFSVKNDLSTEDKGVYNRRLIPKEVFCVLENNGDLYREALKKAELALEREKDVFKPDSEDKRAHEKFERAKKRLERERIAESRLFAIDAGLDHEKLREKYADRTKFLITKGLVKPRYSYGDEEKEVTGYIKKLSVENIHVSLKYRQIFDNFPDWTRPKHNEPRHPRYEVELAYGSRLEPWIVSVQQIADN